MIKKVKIEKLMIYLGVENYTFVRIKRGLHRSRKKRNDMVMGIVYVAITE